MPTRAPATPAEIAEALAGRVWTWREAADHLRYRLHTTPARAREWLDLAAAAEDTPVLALYMVGGRPDSVRRGEDWVPWTTAYPDQAQPVLDTLGRPLAPGVTPGHFTETFVLPADLLPDLIEAGAAHAEATAAARRAERQEKARKIREVMGEDYTTIRDFVRSFEDRNNVKIWADVWDRGDGEEGGHIEITLLKDGIAAFAARLRDLTGEK